MTDSSAVRKIIHIDMDAFYASVEQRDEPAYRGKPLVVGGTPQGRGVVAAASYEARRYGIRSAMSAYSALKACPHLIMVRPRFEVYKAISQQIRAIFEEYTDIVEPLSLDEAYLDVTVNKKGIQSATLIAQEIKNKIRKVTGLNASAGISYNKFLAKLASDADKPNGFCLITPEGAEAFLENLPIGSFYGIGQKTAPRLIAMGIKTGADLKSLSELQMQELFGKSGSFYYQLVRGVDHREVETDWVRKSVGSENTFASDLDDPDEMLAELRPLAEEVLGWMTRNNNFGRTLTLKVKYADFVSVTRSKTLLQPPKTLEAIMDIVTELLEKTEAGPRKVRLLGVSFSGLDLALEEAARNRVVKHPPVQQLQLALAAV